MKIEISAGGIVVRKNKNSWEVLLMRDMSNNWTFPKGLVEKGEDLVAAAAREIQEEVGLSDVRFIAKLPTIRYMYQRNGLISKVVHYFLFTSSGTATLAPQKEEGIKEARWVPIDQAREIIGYPKTNAPLLVKVTELLRQSTK